MTKRKDPDGPKLRSPERRTPSIPIADKLEAPLISQYTPTATCGKLSSRWETLKCDRPPGHKGGCLSYVFGGSLAHP